MTRGGTPLSARQSPGYIVGAGAHGRVTAAVWKRMEPDRSLYFRDDNESLQSRRIDGLEVQGPVDALASLSDEALSDGPAVVSIAIGLGAGRLAIAKRLGNRVAFARIVDPSAVVMPSAELGDGAFVGPGAIVHTGARLGSHVLINTGAIVEHDCVVEDGASLSPGVCMAGRVHIESLAFLAVGVTIVGRVRIGAGAIVGAGSTVTRDVPEGMLAFGSPAKVVRRATARDWERLF